MLDDLYERGVTVNAPFCCARGAVELKRWARLESWARWRRSDAERDARRFSSMNRRGRASRVRWWRWRNVFWFRGV